MDNQHQKIKGYRDLSQDEINLMNDVKALAEQVDVCTSRLKTMPDLDQCWVAIGVTHLQQGFMAVVRGIARPTTF